ncbi:hypothetical protein [Streptomyces sp. NPDC056883]
MGEHDRAFLPGGTGGLRGVQGGVGRGTVPEQAEDGVLPRSRWATEVRS